MYRPDRMKIIFESAKKTGLPVWAGFSARKSCQGQSLSLTDDYDLSFKDLIEGVKHYNLDAVGIMHCEIKVIEDCIKDLKETFNLPVMAITGKLKVSFKSLMQSSITFISQCIMPTASKL